jgi:hypothetical membrane protein
MRLERILLLAAVAVPILYFGNLVVSSLFYPGYSHVTQYASELGGPDAPRPDIFNCGVMLTGLATVAAGWGFFFAVRRLAGNSLLAVLTGLVVVLAGTALVMGGLFPMPDPRHGAYGMGLGLHLAPVFLVLALWKRQNLRVFKAFLIVAAAAVIGMFAVMMGIGGLVRRANVGVFQRLYALTMFPWIGVAGYVLHRELLHSGGGNGPRVRENSLDPSL